MTPLAWAVEKSHDNIAELLIENGANPHIMSKFLKTPYIIAREKNNEFIINLIEMLPTTPCTPLSMSNFDSSVFTNKTSTPSSSSSSTKVKEEPPELPAIVKPPLTLKRERFHSYDSGADSKRLKSSQQQQQQQNAKNLTLQLLKEQMTMMSSGEDSLIQSALHSGRKIMLTEAGRRLLNDSNLNKFLKIPLNTTISSTPSPSSTSSSASTSLNVSRKSVSPRSSALTAVATTTTRRTSDSAADILEIFRESNNSMSSKIAANADILNIIRSTSDLQEVTITQRSSKASPVSSPIQKSAGVSLSAINLNVPKAKAQNLSKTKNSQLPSSQSSDALSTNSSDFRSKCHNISINNNVNNHHNNHNNHSMDDDDDFSRPETVRRKYSELFNNYQQLKKSFDREREKSDVLQRQLTHLQTNFESYKRQQQLKLDSTLQVLLQNSNASERRATATNKCNKNNSEDTNEIL